MFVDAFLATLGVLVACSLFALAVGLVALVIAAVWVVVTSRGEGDEAR